MPSCLAIAAPVTTSSPVTIRTRMLAAWAFRTASLDSALGGSIIPTIAVICRSFTFDSRSPSGSKSEGSMSRVAATMIRRPCSPRRSISWLALSFCSSPQGTLVPFARADAARPITAGPAPLTNIRTTAFPDASLASAKTAMSLYVGSNGSVARRG